MSFFTKTDLAHKLEELNSKVPNNYFKYERGPNSTSISFNDNPGTLPADFKHQLSLYRKDGRKDRLKFLGLSGATSAAATLGIAGGFATPSSVKAKVDALSVAERNKILLSEGAVLAGLMTPPFAEKSKSNLPKAVAAGVYLGALGALAKGYAHSPGFSTGQKLLAGAGTIATGITPYLAAKSGEAGQILADEELENDIVASNDTLAGRAQRIARVRNGIGLNRVYPQFRYVPKPDSVKNFFVQHQERIMDQNGRNANVLHGKDQQEVYEKLKAYELTKELNDYERIHGKTPTSRQLASIEKKIEKKLVKEML